MNQKKKTFREQLNQVPTMASSREFGRTNVPVSRAPISKPTEPTELTPSPPTEQEPLELDIDNEMTDYLVQSQTMDGPDSGKVPEANVPAPQTMAEFYRKWKQVPTELSAEDRAMFTNKLAELDEKMLEAEKRYESQKTRTGWAEVAEMLGQAMVQLMAARDAAQNNWNVGGVKFDRTNWEARYDRALREYDSRKDTIGRQQATVSRTLEGADRKAERLGTAEQNLLARDYFTTQARIQAEARRSAKEDEANLKDNLSKERAAKEKAKSYIANYEAAQDAVNKLEAGTFENDKEKQKLLDKVTDSLRRNGHIGVSDEIKARAEAKKGGIWGFFQSDDYAPLKQYIETNKTRGVKSVFQGYGVPVPDDIKSALSGEPIEENRQPSTENKVPLSAEDQAAKAWADANPNDPRAVQIQERLKAKGY